ncbi:MAG TPA: nickel-responsive transcriptional regulator NikR [Planctomycetia bacterium]|nr:nickel-responsive transcriptional regulator NikR [Planctomycetia bacterium]
MSMKTDLARVSISLEDSLLEHFDSFVDEKGYATRSEAIRDLIREKLLSPDEDEDDRLRVGVLTVVYGWNHSDLPARLADKQRRFAGLVMASTQVQVGDDHVLQVLILRGPAAEVRRFSDSLLATKGVLHGDLRMTGDATDLAALTARLPASSSNRLLAVMSD